MNKSSSDWLFIFEIMSALYLLIASNGFLLKKSFSIDNKVSKVCESMYFWITGVYTYFKSDYFDSYIY
jgi:hypothetical protein